MSEISNEIYVVTDVESDGPCPGPYSMLSFSSVVMTADKEVLSKFSANLLELPGASVCKDTMKFWSEYPDAWKAHRESPVNPEYAMQKYVSWYEDEVRSLGKPVFVSHPSGFDFTFMYWYCLNFVKRSPFGFSGLDMRSYFAGMNKCDYKKTTKSYMPNRWREEAYPHTHIAYDDALETGCIFINMLRQNKGLPEIGGLVFGKR